MPAFPRTCRPSAFTLFADQMPLLEGSHDALLRAAIAISMHEHPVCDVGRTIGRIDELAERVRGRVLGGSEEALLAHAHAVLFDEEGFLGNSAHYFEAANSYLPLVLDRKLGIPISLSLLYVSVLQRLGLDAQGVHSPGHFLVRVASSGRVAFVDAFHRGRMHSHQEALAFLAQVHGRALDPASALPIATPRQWLYRMLQNLKGIFRDAGRTLDHAAMLELEALLENPTAR